MNDLPGMQGTPAPFLPKRYVARTLGLSSSFDAGRGVRTTYRLGRKGH